MALTGKTTEEKIWNYLIKNGLSQAGAAGLMGNLYAESGLRPTNLQNSYETRFGLTDSTYTAAVDEGKYRYGSYSTAAGSFAHDNAGYGLAQWTYWSRKQALYKAAKARGTSIGDLETQLSYLISELKTGFPAVYKALGVATLVKESSDIVMTRFERPANQSDTAKNLRASYGMKYYDKFAKMTASEGNEPAPTTNTFARQAIIEAAESYLGCKESDGSHKKIIDLYNANRPSGYYKMQYTDAWCATFASVAAVKVGYTDIIPMECSCERQIALFKKLGCWRENENYTPKPGDYIYYDWQDGSNYATTDNTGHSDHVGIVVSVTGQTIKVIEGNMSNAVGYRNISVNGRYIRGYGLPDYASKAKTSGAPEHLISREKNITGKTVYVVKRGDSLWTIARDTLGDGTRWREIQNYNGLSSALIHPGDELKIPEK